MDLEQRAKDFATIAHQGQTRKYTNDAYISHPAAVVELVRSVPHTIEMIAAAWLHDVVEDTDVSLADIEKNFGHLVSIMVSDLTDISRAADGNRAKRKAIDLAHTSEALPDSKTIKLADLIDNTKSIVAYDPKFASVYLQEKELLLEVLTEGDPALLLEARRVLQEAKSTLGQHRRSYVS